MADNLALVVSPSRAGLAAASVVCHKEGPGSLIELVGTSWPLGGKLHLLDCIKTDARILLEIDPYAIFLPKHPDNENITHLALLEGDEGEGATYFFGSEKVTRLGLIMWFNKDTGQFIPFHCTTCGRSVAQYLTEVQYVVGGRTAQGSSNLN